VRRGKTGRKNPLYRHGDNDGRRRWRATTETACRWCGSDKQLRLHHVVYEQHVRDRRGDCWDPRNGLTLCLSCHSKHHNGTDSHVPIDRLRPENFAFAVELLGPYAVDYFMRYYHAEREEVLPRLPLQLALEDSSPDKESEVSAQ